MLIILHGLSYLILTTVLGSEEHYYPQAISNRAGMQTEPLLPSL